jgi:hypothetical protein
MSDRFFLWLSVAGLAINAYAWAFIPMMPEGSAFFCGLGAGLVIFWGHECAA